MCYSSEYRFSTARRLSFMYMILALVLFAVYLVVGFIALQRQATRQGGLFDPILGGWESILSWMFWPVSLIIEAVSGRLAHPPAPQAGQAPSTLVRVNRIAAGATGMALTDLTPNGTIEIDGQQVTAQAQTSLIFKGQQVIVVGRLRSILLVKLADAPLT
jgi:membrane-bound ClpP family serine protease